MVKALGGPVVAAADGDAATDLGCCDWADLGAAPMSLNTGPFLIGFAPTAGGGVNTGFARVVNLGGWGLAICEEDEGE